MNQGGALDPYAPAAPLTGPPGGSSSQRAQSFAWRLPMNHSNQSESKLDALHTLPRGPWPLVSSDAKRLECAQLAGAFRFMVPPRANFRVEALHESPIPSGRPSP